ncbi:MAG: flagellar protein [Lachnospiraceae bacterium]|nr:flagellar protein [Lachnospiraceae bacterium]
MNIQNSPYLSAVQVPKNSSAVTGNYLPQSDGLSFEQILNQKAVVGGETGELKFSKHATSRLAERNISLSSEQLTRLKEGTDKASGKGIKEPLVLIDDLAFIVSTGSRTVITAMGSGTTEENIFTNIDGAVIN